MNNMDRITLKDNISIWGVQVKGFPDGIDEAFNSLMSMLPDGLDREYYGYSYMDGQKVIYFAMTVENIPGEAERYNATRQTIEKGDYVAVTVKDWKAKTHTIKDVFHEMMENSQADSNSPAIEWYKSDEEMVCMVKCLRPEVAGRER